MVPIDSPSGQWNHETVASSSPKSSTYTRTLALAAETLGGAQPLAQRLKVEQATLERWIAGEEFPPHEAFLHALDIVAAGPRVDPAEFVRAHRARAKPEQSSSGQFRQVQPKDGAPASNKPGEDEHKNAKG